MVELRTWALFSPFLQYSPSNYISPLILSLLTLSPSSLPSLIQYCLYHLFSSTLSLPPFLLLYLLFVTLILAVYFTSSLSHFLFLPFLLLLLYLLFVLLRLAYLSLSLSMLFCHTFPFTQQSLTLSF